MSSLIPLNTVRNLGHAVLESTFLVGAAVTTYLASAARPGMCPYRVVILDSTYTVGQGNNLLAPVKYPATTPTFGEKLIGVLQGPVESLPKDKGYVPDAGAYYPILQGRSCDVRLLGTSAIYTDTTTTSTNILAGDLVKSSVTANQDGMVCKATLVSSHNRPDIDQHIIGTAFNTVSINNGVVMALINTQES